MATTAERLKQLMAEAGDDQSDVADAVGCTQGAISLIVLGRTLRSRYLPDIASYYGVSVNWLRGEDVPRNDGTPTPPRPVPSHIFMRVELPTTDALTAMFEGLLDGIDPALTQDARARLLAERLPIGLSQLADALPDRPRKRRQAAREEARADLAMSDREP